jgi:hypothetical protein
MSTPTEVQIAVETSLARVGHELVAIDEALERLETQIAFIASAAAAK